MDLSSLINLTTVVSLKLNKWTQEILRNRCQIPACRWSLVIVKRKWASKEYKKNNTSHQHVFRCSCREFWDRSLNIAIYWHVLKNCFVICINSFIQVWIYYAKIFKWFQLEICSLGKSCKCINDCIVTVSYKCQYLFFKSYNLISNLEELLLIETVNNLINV